MTPMRYSVTIFSPGVCNSKVRKIYINRLLMGGTAETTNLVTASLEFQILKREKVILN